MAGLGNIQWSGQVPASPSLAGANNGLSLSGLIAQLGQREGILPAVPAVLLENRVVPQGGFLLRFIDNADLSENTGVTINGSIYPFAGFGGGGISCTVNGAFQPGAAAVLSLADTNDGVAFGLLYYSNGTLSLQWGTANVVTMDNNLVVLIGEDSTVTIDAIFNGGAVTGYLGYKTAMTVQTSPFNINVEKSGSIFTNEGAVVGGSVQYNLPPAGGTARGLRYGFLAIAGGAYMDITLQDLVNDVIFFAFEDGTFLESNIPGSVIWLVSDGDGRWIVESSTGGWILS